MSNIETTSILEASSIASDATSELVCLAVKHGGNILANMPNNGSFEQSESILDRARKSHRAML